MERTVLFEVQDKVALITLNRPERHNAICQDLLVNLYNYVDEVADNDEIRVAIITGAGKSFCSGIDLSVIGKEDLLNPRGDGKDLPDVLRPCKKPIIGAINGNTITGSFELALNCDFLIASENARFTDSHAKIGIHPGWGMTQLLQQAVGLSEEYGIDHAGISSRPAGTVIRYFASYRPFGTIIRFPLPRSTFDMSSFDTHGCAHLSAM